MDARIRASRAQEQRLADALDGNRTPGSGNQWSRKNDVRSPRYSVEAKTTTKSQFILKARDLETGERQALLDGREFLFALQMCGRNWILLPEEDFLVREEGATDGP